MTWLLDTMLATGVLIAAVLVLRRPVAKLFGPGMAYALWALPLLRLALPPLLLPARQEPVRMVQLAPDLTLPVGLPDPAPEVPAGLDWLAIGRAFFGDGQCLRLSDLTPERWVGVARPAMIVADVAPAPAKPPVLGMTPAMIRMEFLKASKA